jgi:hypothetical protein
MKSNSYVGMSSSVSFFSIFSSAGLDLSENKNSNFGLGFAIIPSTNVYQIEILIEMLHLTAENPHE